MLDYPNLAFVKSYLINCLCNKIHSLISDIRFWPRPLQRQLAISSGPIIVYAQRPAEQLADDEPNRCAAFVSNTNIEHRGGNLDCAI